MEEESDDSNNVLPLENWRGNDTAEEGTGDTATSETLPEISAADTEHMKLYESIIGLYDGLGVLLSIKMEYGEFGKWKWLKSPRFWFAMFVLANSWISITYTVYYHYRKGDYTKILEPLSLVSLISGVR